MIDKYAEAHNRIRRLAYLSKQASVMDKLKEVDDKLTLPPPYVRKFNNVMFSPYVTLPAGAIAGGFAMGGMGSGNNIKGTGARFDPMGAVIGMSLGGSVSAINSELNRLRDKIKVLEGRK